MFVDDRSVVWCKSSYSQGEAACVEIAHVPAKFRKSSYSASQTACVEVADWPTGAGVRDTQNRELGVLFFPNGEWESFLRIAKY